MKTKFKKIIENKEKELNAKRSAKKEEASVMMHW